MSSEQNTSLLKLDVTTFFISISSAAMMGLREGQKNLPLVRQNIELLELMKDKMKGNLTEAEGKLLEQLLFELRMRFVESSKG